MESPATDAVAEALAKDEGAPDPSVLVFGPGGMDAHYRLPRTLPAI